MKEKRLQRVDPEPKELRLRGTVASPGVAVARCFKHDSGTRAIVKRRIAPDQVDTEIERLKRAIAAARAEIEQIHTEANRTVGDALSKIFEAQLLILDDTTFLKAVTDDIARLKLNAEFVYSLHIQKSLRSLQKSNDAYLREMANDIKAITARVFGFLIGHHVNKLVDNKRKVALGEDFSPGEVVLINKYSIPGFATQSGGPTSHMVLIAKSLGIPAVVGVPRLLERCPSGAVVVVDGDNGQVIVNPAPETLQHYEKDHGRRRVTIARRLRDIARIPSAARDGTPVEVRANLEVPTDIDQMLASNKVGVGLYRTEFFYLSQMEFPSEDEQARIYTEIARTFFPNSVTMRAFDLGSDKVANELRNTDEANPALGWRGIRLGLDLPEIFKTQVRALLRASLFRNVSIMLPMVTTAMEVIKAKRVIQTAMKELQAEGVQYDENIDIGIMIEVPAAALMAHELARHVCFFSIGTNDLVQYTLAADRGNKKVAHLYRELHPAVLRLIKMAIDAGHQRQITVSMCGELAAREVAVPLLFGMGLRSFSVVPPKIAVVKKIINNLDTSECEILAQRVLNLGTVEKVEAVLKDWFQSHLGSLVTETQL